MLYINFYCGNIYKVIVLHPESVNSQWQTYIEKPKLIDQCGDILTAASMRLLSLSVYTLLTYIYFDKILSQTMYNLIVPHDRLTEMLCKSFCGVMVHLNRGFLLGELYPGISILPSIP